MEEMLPGIGPDVVGGSYCPLDGHVNSLRLFRALHTARCRPRRANTCPATIVENDRRTRGGEFS